MTTRLAMSLWGELKRRKVVQVATVYAVVAWLLVQIVATVKSPLSLPEWFDTAVIILLAVGFPVAVILAWAFDVGPGGIRAAAPAPSSTNRAPAGSLFANLSQALILLAVGFLIVDQYLLDTGDRGERASAAPVSAPETISRFALTITENQPVANSRWPIFALSPNGRRFAYQADGGLYVRDFDTLETRLVSGSENAFANPFFSPDGRFLAYYSNGGDLVRLAVEGGAPTVVATALRGINGGSWADDGAILYIEDSGGIKRVSANGGDVEVVVPNEAGAAFGGAAFGSPQLLPDGDSLLFSRAPRENWDEGEIVVHSIATGEERTLLTGGSDARYVESGHLLYMIGDSIFGVAFDLDALRVSGTPRELVSGVNRALATSAADYGVARDGTLAYMSRLSQQRRVLVWVDRAGSEHEIDAMPGNYWYAQLAPGEESKIALNGWEGRERHVWIADLARGTRQRLSFGSRQTSPVVWAPNGRVAYAVGGEIVLQRADGARAPEILYTSSALGLGLLPSGFTPDGRALLAMNFAPPRSTWLVPVDKTTAEPAPLLDSPFSEYNATVSPDGRWLAYQSDETGRLEIFVRRYPDVDAGGKWQVSTNGGLLPVWSRDPDRLELFFLEPKDNERRLFTLMAAPVRTNSDESFLHDLPVRLFERRFFANFSTFYSPYDVSTDGRRFLTIKDAPLEDATSGTSEIVIVQNWIEELNRLVPRE